MISLERLSATLRNRKWIWIGLVLALIEALRIYYVQEVLAALIILSLLFFGMSVAVLMMFLLLRAGRYALAWVTPFVARLIRWGVDEVAGVIAKPTDSLG